MWMKKQPLVAGVRCMCVLVCKRDRDDVKNESVTEQSQVLVWYRLKAMGVVNHMTLTRVSSFI